MLLPDESSALVKRIQYKGLLSCSLHDAGEVMTEIDLTRALERIREAIRPYPPAALFALAEEGYRSPFEVLVACVLSIRTRDETTVPVARRLFAEARTPEALLQLAPSRLLELIRPVTFAEQKVEMLHAIAHDVLTRYHGHVPCTDEALRGFRGVGPKCANLTLTIACGIPRIAVDVHVHRIVNRWGYVQTRTPEETLQALEVRVPRALWGEINPLLVPFGKHYCTPTRPWCSRCPVVDMCARVGVSVSR